MDAVLKTTHGLVSVHRRIYRRVVCAFGNLLPVFANLDRLFAFSLDPFPAV